MKNRHQRWFRARIALLGLCVAVVAVVVLFRAFHLQIASGDRLREMAEGQHLRELRVSPRRGAIYDRHGAELAVSADVDSVYANPRRLKAMGEADLQDSRPRPGDAREAIVGGPLFRLDRTSSHAQ